MKHAASNTPVTYDAAGTTTPLVTAAPVLDVVA